jgi:hypothetical protein
VTSNASSTSSDAASRPHPEQRAQTRPPLLTLPPEESCPGPRVAGSRAYETACRIGRMPYLCSGAIAPRAGCGGGIRARTFKSPRQWCASTTVGCRNRSSAAAVPGAWITPTGAVNTSWPLCSTGRVRQSRNRLLAKRGADPEADGEPASVFPRASPLLAASGSFIPCLDAVPLAPQRG